MQKILGERLSLYRRDPDTRSKLDEDQWRMLILEFRTNKKKTVKEICEEYGISRNALYSRLKKEFPKKEEGTTQAQRTPTNAT